MSVCAHTCTYLTCCWQRNEKATLSSRFLSSSLWGLGPLNWDKVFYQQSHRPFIIYLNDCRPAWLWMSFSSWHGSDSPLHWQWGYEPRRTCTGAVLCVHLVLMVVSFDWLYNIYFCEDISKEQEKKETEPKHRLYHLWATKE